MTRRTYRQNRETLELVEINDDDYTPSLRGDASLWGDRGYDGLRTTDGMDISSRTKHRDYMKRHGLTTHDDFKGEFERRQKERDAYRSGERGSVNRRDIESAIDRMTRR